MKFIGIQIFEVSIVKVGVGLYHFLAHFLLLLSHFFDFCECHAFESCQVSKTDLLLPLDELAHAEVEIGSGQLSQYDKLAIYQIRVNFAK